MRLDKKLSESSQQQKAWSMPPSVVKTVPEAGETGVDPSLEEVSVTFSKDMMTKQMWSWCSQTAESFPQIDKARIRYLKDKRTCVLPVQLKPGRTYVIWINSQKYNAFRDTENSPAVPDGKYVVIQFKTSFENKKSVIETITPMLDNDGRWRVSGYFVK